MSETSSKGSEYESSLKDSDSSIAAFEQKHRGVLGTAQHFLHGSPTMVPVIVLILSVIVFGIVADNFFSAFNLSLIMQQVAIVGILAAAQSLVILTAGIDLSVAAVMVMISVIMGRLSVEFGIPAPIAILIGFVCGTATGFLNGALVTQITIKRPYLAIIYGVVVLLIARIWYQVFPLFLPKPGEIEGNVSVVPEFLFFPINVITALIIGAILGAIITLAFYWLVTRVVLPPFITTLGTWNIFLALNYYFSSRETIRSQTLDADAPLLKLFGERFNIGNAVLTWGVVLMVAIFLVLWYILNRTAWGRHVYAIGDDKEAAELAGIRTDRTLISVYMLSGFICALAAWASIGRVGSVSPTSFFEANLESITAVVIGGISLFGGRGSILGPMIGALIVGVFNSGLRLAGVDVLWQLFATGWLIIIAVAIDQWIRKISS